MDGEDSLMDGGDGVVMGRADGGEHVLAGDGGHCCGRCYEPQAEGKLSREAQSSRCRGGAKSSLQLHPHREPCMCTGSLL